MPTVKAASKLRVMLAGFGAFGQVHAQAWRRHGTAVELTIAEPDPALRSQAAAELPGTKIVADALPLLPDVDAIDIVTPADTHAGLVIAALQAGCDVLVEKPFVTSAGEARLVEAAIRGSDRLLQVGYFFRAHPLAQALRARVGNGSAPIWIDADFTSLKRPRRDAGAIANDAVHFIDLVCWLVGRAPSTVTAILRHPLGRQSEDIALIILGWPDGLVARVQASCVIAGPLPDPVVPGGWSRKSVRVTTRDRQIVADFMRDILIERPARLDTLPQGGWRTVVGDVSEAAFEGTSTLDVVTAEIASFLGAIASRAPTIAGFASGLDAVRICDAALRSAREQRTISLDD